MVQRVANVEWPDGLAPEGAVWDMIAAGVIAAKPDILITNELPFGEWIAARSTLDRSVAMASIEIHKRGASALIALGLPAIISSRPAWSGHRLVNEAIAIKNGNIICVHRKQYLAAECSWYETSWYGRPRSGFATAPVQDLSVGVMLCTELMSTNMLAAMVEPEQI